ncbi:MAG: hypothetical protein L0Y74_11480, partial [candidate division Zixibacteria bacterium]|nr:hypothetical protein [candidate division Zixibacteria bacterium]
MNGEITTPKSTGEVILWEEQGAAFQPATLLPQNLQPYRPQILQKLEQVMQNALEVYKHKDTIQAFVYQFKVGEKPVAGIGTVGCELLCNVLFEFGLVIEEAGAPVKTEETEDYITISAPAERKIYIGVTPDGKGGAAPVGIPLRVWGSKRQPKWQWVNDNSDPSGRKKVRKDVNAPWENGVSKAYRNAKLKVLPKDIKDAFVKIARKMNAVVEGRGEEYDAPETTQGQKPSKSKPVPPSASKPTERPTKQGNGNHPADAPAPGEPEMPKQVMSESEIG